jgi:hypothetical protein
LLPTLTDNHAALLLLCSERRNACGWVVDNTKLEIALSISLARELSVEGDLSIRLIDGPEHPQLPTRDLRSLDTHVGESRRCGRSCEHGEQRELQQSEGLSGQHKFDLTRGCAALREENRPNYANCVASREASSSVAPL